MAMTMKVRAGITTLLDCRRAGRSPIFAAELIMNSGCALSPRTNQVEDRVYPTTVERARFSGSGTIASGYFGHFRGSRNTCYVTSLGAVE
jgi:hypothetical protein